MSLFGKKTIESLSALKGVEAKDITAEQIAAVNNELAEADVKGIEVNALGALANAQATAEQTINDLTAQLTASQELVAEKEAKITELTEKLAKTPAGAAAAIEVEDDKITGKDEEDAVDLDAEMTAEFKRKHRI